MKSLSLIASLLTWDLATAQLSVGLGLNLTVLAATCNQEPTRGLVGLINALPLVTGILACSTFNRKFVTATATSTRYIATSNITQTTFTVSTAPTPTVIATENTTNLGTATSTSRTVIAATSYTTVAETVTRTSSFIVSMFTETPTTTFYTGTITGAARKREEQSSAPPSGEHRRDAQLLDGLVGGILNLPALLGLPSSIVSLVCSCVATGPPNTVATSTSTISAISSATTTIVVTSATTPTPFTERTTLFQSATRTILENETVTSTIALTQTRTFSQTTTTSITTTSTETLATTSYRVQATYTPRPNICSDAVGAFDVYISGDENSTRQKCIDRCAARSDCRFVFFAHYKAGCCGGTADCSMNKEQFFCSSQGDIGGPHGGGAIYDKIAATTVLLYD